MITFQVKMQNIGEGLLTTVVGESRIGGFPTTVNIGGLVEGDAGGVGGSGG